MESSTKMGKKRVSDCPKWQAFLLQAKPSLALTFILPAAAKPYTKLKENKWHSLLPFSNKAYVYVLTQR